jgi:hypothetical protein
VSGARSTRSLALAVALLALGAAGCGERLAMPASCRSGADAVRAALRAAPGRVVLGDGTLISTCVEQATGDADLQREGTILTAAADGLAQSVAASDRAALRLGFLVGAVERGAQHTNGVHAELVQRLRQSPGLEAAPAARRRAFRRGEAAGRARG